MHDHAHHAAAVVSGLWPLVWAMFFTGLAGGFGHCVGMCGPFVMAQVAGGIAGRGPLPVGASVLVRARSGVLLPYHLGRMTTYTVMGGVMAGISGMVVTGTGFRWLLGVVMLLAALLFLQQAVKGAARWYPWLARLSGGGAGREGLFSRIGVSIARPLRPLLADPRGMNGYVLGLALGFLPCGFLYAALASAVGTGDMLTGGLVMGAFALGTVPSLITVGMLGSVAAARWTTAMKAVSPVLMLVNAVLLIGMAQHVLG